MAMVKAMLRFASLLSPVPIPQELPCVTPLLAVFASLALQAMVSRLAAAERPLLVLQMVPRIIPTCDFAVVVVPLPTQKRPPHPQVPAPDVLAPL